MQIEERQREARQYAPVPSYQCSECDALARFFSEACYFCGVFGKLKKISLDFPRKFWYNRLNSRN
jgi:hypothetical protein